jgi:dethiobiotin synthetase
MTRLYVTGTDTEVGKTRVAAVIARALQDAGRPTTVVKLVQTGIGPQEPGDAQIAAALAECAAFECRRFNKAADPWTAARSEGRDPVRVGELTQALAGVSGSIVVEGSGGAAVPLNASETISDAAWAAALASVVVVGLRLGCINHARLTIEYLANRGIPLLGIVLCENRPLEDPGYAGEVEYALRSSGRIIGTIPYDPDAPAAIRRGAELFSFLQKA